VVVVVPVRVDDVADGLGREGLHLVGDAPGGGGEVAGVHDEDVAVVDDDEAVALDRVGEGVLPDDAVDAVGEPDDVILLRGERTGGAGPGKEEGERYCSEKRLSHSVILSSSRVVRA